MNRWTRWMKVAKMDNNNNNSNNSEEEEKESIGIKFTKQKANAENDENAID